MSTNPRIYLDFNATAPLIPAAREAIRLALDETFGNPSSIHTEGRRARDLVERARSSVAGLLGRPREQVVFTSGGTEANTLGVAMLAAIAEARGLPRVAATTAIEHPSLLGAVRALSARGWEVRLLPVSPQLAVELGPLEGAGLVAVAAVNHELGTRVPASLLPAARAAGALIHVDAVQAAGKLALGALTADTLAISGHKLGAPAGVGALAITIADDPVLPEAGHQERGRRGGTENVLGIVGFGAAASVADPAAWGTVAALGERLEAGLRALPDVRIHGAEAPRVGGTINAGFTGARGESIVIALDLAGVAVSTGAACTSGSVQPSAVLRAIGLPVERAREGVRFSLGRSTSAAELDAVVARLPGILARARRPA